MAPFSCAGFREELLKTTFTNKKSWLLGTAALALVASAPVYAQETSEDAEDEQATLDVVTVTGIRGSIQNSLNAKKNATSIVEAISAEDIGKLPDLSIADSLARLPGVTAQRVRGRSQQISIRGLGPDFSLALWNGREVVSAGNNRGVEFDQFPSELVAQGVVSVVFLSTLYVIAVPDDVAFVAYIIWQISVFYLAGLGKKLAIISLVGQCSTLTLPFSTWSVTK